MPDVFNLVRPQVVGFLADDDSTFKVCEDYMIYHIKKKIVLGT